MARIRRYTWFLEPLNAETNALISRALPEERAYKGIECEGGVSRDVWECEHSDIHRIRKSIMSFPFLDFRVYMREGNGSIRLWPFQNRRRTRIERRLAKKGFRVKQSVSQ